MKNRGAITTGNDPVSQGSARKLQRWLKMVRWGLLVTTLLCLTYAILAVYAGIAHNTGGEACRYVGEGEFYHLRIYGDPCVITGHTVLMFFLAYGIPAIVLQPPLLIAWVVLRRRISRLST